MAPWAKGAPGFICYHIYGVAFHLGIFLGGAATRSLRIHLLPSVLRITCRGAGAAVFGLIGFAMINRAQPESWHQR
jgi:formate hydrogenlyase subunit 3/multisubunit Na+/H+ antiporter MnhD subunit